MIIPYSGEFRSRLLKAGAEDLLFDRLLVKLREKRLLKARGRQRTDSTHVLGAIRAMNRLECVVETMRHALNCLLVDTGYVEAKLLVTAPRQYGVDLYGPTRADGHWQSQAGRGFDAGSFQIDWNKQEATCPEGKRSLCWSPAIDDRRRLTLKLRKLDKSGRVKAVSVSYIF